MRPLCLGLLLLISTTTGCADLDAGGFMEDYNGFPWPSLLSKAPPQGRTTTAVQTPQFSETGRFARQPAAPADAGSSKITPVGQAPAEESPAEE